MQRYWSSLRYCPRDSVFVGCRSSSTLVRLSRAGFLSFPAPLPCRVSISQSTGILGIALPALLSHTKDRNQTKRGRADVVVAAVAQIGRVVAPLRVRARQTPDRGRTGSETKIEIMLHGVLLTSL